VAKLILLLVLCGLLRPVATSVQAESPPEYTLGVVDERPDRLDFPWRQFGALRDCLGARLRNGVRIAHLLVARGIVEMGERVQAREAVAGALLEMRRSTDGASARAERIAKFERLTDAGRSIIDHWRSLLAQGLSVI
jgi:hypothetical protein